MEAAAVEALDDDALPPDRGSKPTLHEALAGLDLDPHAYAGFKLRKLARGAYEGTGEDAGDGAYRGGR